MAKFAEKMTDSRWKFEDGLFSGCSKIDDSVIKSSFHEDNGAFFWLLNDFFWFFFSFFFLFFVLFRFFLFIFSTFFLSFNFSCSFFSFSLFLFFLHLHSFFNFSLLNFFLLFLNLYFLFLFLNLYFLFLFLDFPLLLLFLSFSSLLLLLNLNFLFLFLNLNFLLFLFNLNFLLFFLNFFLYLYSFLPLIRIKFIMLHSPAGISNLKRKSTNSSVHNKELENRKLHLLGATTDRFIWLYNSSKNIHNTLIRDPNHVFDHLFGDVFWFEGTGLQRKIVLPQKNKTTITFSSGVV